MDWFNLDRIQVHIGIAGVATRNIGEIFGLGSPYRFLCDWSRLSLCRRSQLAIQ